jgi:lipid II isoglutaminyl synthase (glutamine-hydrolysing)
MKITLGYLYPDIMGTYGDRGNVETVRRRCGWRGIDADVVELRIGDRLDPAATDLVMIGGGGEAEQRLVAADLFKVKAAAIREAVAMGAGALAVGCGFELFGRFCQPEQGVELPGVQLFDAWTLRRTAVLSGRYDTITQARADRAIGELVVRWGDTMLVGFENHGGGTYLGPAARPLGLVLAGQGNNGDGTEGVLLGGAVGTHLRGPCLPRNPALADYLISAAVSRRYGPAELPPLPDELEQAAHDVALQRACGSRRDRAGRTVPGLARAALLSAAPRRAGRRAAQRIAAAVSHDAEAAKKAPAWGTIPVTPARPDRGTAPGTPAEPAQGTTQGTPAEPAQGTPRSAARPRRETTPGTPAGSGVRT